ncbi:MAG: outer membrane biosynthesis protein TonB, partial [Algoriphagus sp.]
MKTLLASFFLVFLTSSVLFAQENSDRRQDMNKFLSKNLIYPVEARSNEVEGLVVIQVIFDEQGQPINTTV